MGKLLQGLQHLEWSLEELGVTSGKWDVEEDINRVNKRDPEQSPLASSDRLIIASSVDLEGADGLEAGFYLWVETDAQHDDGGNTVYLTGPFNTALNRSTATGGVGHTSHFESYRGTVVFAGEMFFSGRTMGGVELKAISARSGHYKPTPDDMDNSEVLEEEGDKFCGFCSDGSGGQLPNEFDLQNGNCDDCEDDTEDEEGGSGMTDLERTSMCSTQLQNMKGALYRAHTLGKPLQQELTTQMERFQSLRDVCGDVIGVDGDPMMREYGREFIEFAEGKAGLTGAPLQPFVDGFTV